MSSAIGHNPSNIYFGRYRVSGHANNNFDQLKTSLNLAIKSNNHETIKQCLTDILNTDKINESLTGNGGTPLMVAAKHGYKEIVELLVEAKADVNIADGDGDTALILAAENGYTDIVELLVGAGADVNKADKIGLTALMYAVQDGHADIMKVLFKARADVNKADSDGLTALMLAAKHGHTDIVNVLLGKVENVEEAIDSLVGYKKILIFN